MPRRGGPRHTGSWAVSYTHLDVYKRQGEREPRHRRAGGVDRLPEEEPPEVRVSQWAPARGKGHPPTAERGQDRVTSATLGSPRPPRRQVSPWADSGPVVVSWTQIEQVCRQRPPEPLTAQLAELVVRDPPGGIDVITWGDCRASRQEVGEEDLDQGARRGPMGRVADGQPLIAAWSESDGLEGCLLYTSRCV